MNKLSVVVPVYNEAATLEQIVRRVLAVKLPEGERELILVDDGSSDGSRSIVEKLGQEFPDVIQCVYCSQNRGKGAAVRRGWTRQAVTLSSCKMPIWNMIPKTFAAFLPPTATPGHKSCLGRAPGIVPALGDSVFTTAVDSSPPLRICCTALI